MVLLQNSKWVDRITVLEREGEALRQTLVEHAMHVTERNEAIRACEQVVAEREAAVAACEAVVAEREAEIARLEGVIRRCEQVVLDREATIRAREIVIQGYEQAMEIVRTASPQSRAGRSTPLETMRPNAPRSGSEPDERDHHAGEHQEAESAVQASRMTQDDVDRVLAEWRTVAAKYANHGLTGGQTLIEPYLIERHIHDRIGHQIMAITESQSWYDNAHNTELPELLRLGMLRRGDTVFDCGSNQGLNSVGYARVVGPGGRVVAFDPFDLHIDIGRFNAKLNGIRNIDFIQAGVSNRAEQLQLSMLDQCVGATDVAVPAARSISLLPLDSFASLQPSFIKIDIEGAEVNALEGATELLKSEPALYIEVHPQFISRFDRKPMDLLKHISFDRYQVYIDHPNVVRLSEYHGQFDMTEGCALYCIPRSRIGYLRHLRDSKQNTAVS